MGCQTWTGVIMASLCVAGCVDRSAPQETARPAAVSPAARDGESNQATERVAGRAASSVPLEIKGWKEIQAWISSQAGQLVLIDVWSTFCTPCLQEFPHFVELHNSYGKQVACASLSVDFYGGPGNNPEAVRPQVMQFLQSQTATMQNFISADPDEVVLQRIGVAAVPAVLVYDRKGELRRVFHNDDGEYGPDGFSYQKDIVPFVEELLQAQSE